MKFADIPKFTGEGKYQVNVPLLFLQKWVDDHLAQGLQLNPDFQRGHVWKEEQQIKYVEYLLRGGHAARTFYFNHPGWMRGWKGEFVLVDGLQRLTACLRFLNDEIPAFGHRFSEYEDELPIEIDVLINVNNLKTRREVLNWYIEMNEGGVVHTKEEIDRVRRMIEELKESEQK